MSLTGQISGDKWTMLPSMNDVFERVIIRRIPSRVIKFRIKHGLVRITDRLTFQSRKHTSALKKKLLRHSWNDCVSLRAGIHNAQLLTPSNALF